MTSCNLTLLAFLRRYLPRLRTQAPQDGRQAHGVAQEAEVRGPRAPAGRRAGTDWTHSPSRPSPPAAARYELGRVPGNTKLVTGALSKTVRRIRVRGGHFKFRALKLDGGNFAWPSESVTKKVRILDVAYNASNNELVRDHKRLVAGAGRPS